MKVQASCADDYDPASLTCSEALRRVTDAIKPLTGTETVPIRNALGRVLAADVRSDINVPAHTNSAMDGYAVRGADLPERDEGLFRVVGESFAGRPYGAPIGSGEAVRIMTGAVMPEGSDTVIMQEHVVPEGRTIRVGAGHGTGQNVRQAGEDIADGDTVLAAGRRLTAADIGLSASLGIVELRVYRRPRVAFFSSGDELRSLGETLAPGEIYDSNRYTLHGMLTEVGADMLDMGVVRDEPGAVRRAFEEAAEAADAIISSGGVSVGEADYIKEVLQEVGQVNFWKVAMKPGRPLAFGRIRDAWFFGLPGNPVSVMVTFYQFVQPALRRLMGERDWAPLTFEARSESKLKKRPGRMEFQRGILARDAQDRLVVRKTGAQGSGILNSMSQANCFIILEVEQDTVQPGEMVRVQPFQGLI